MKMIKKTKASNSPKLEEGETSKLIGDIACLGRTPIIDVLLDANPSQALWHQAALGKVCSNTVSENMVMDFSQMSNFVVVGKPGTGGLAGLHVLVEHCINHPEIWEVVVLDLDYDLLSFALLAYDDEANLENKIVFRKDAIAQELLRISEIQKLHIENQKLNGNRILVVIPNFVRFREVILDSEHKSSHHPYTKHPFLDGRKILEFLDELILSSGNSNIDFAIHDTSYESLPYAVKAGIDEGTTKCIGMGLDFLESFGEESISSQGIALDVSRDSLGEKKFIINTPRVFQKLGGNPENIVRNKRIYERMLQQEAS